MKNSNALSLVLCIGILVVIGCNCPNMDKIQKELEKSSASPSPSSSSTPAKTGSDDVELTMEKFNKIKNGMSYEDCVEIMGGEGNQIVSAGEGKYKVESYKWEGPNFQYVMLSFMGGKLNSKAQNGLK
jgi:hypothetical protein